MLTARAKVKDTEDKYGRIIADVSVRVDSLNYERCFERLYPMILDRLSESCSGPGGFPHLFEKLQEIKGMTSEAVVKFLSSFPDDIKEELIKSAFDDIFTEEYLASLNEKLAGMNIGAAVDSVELNTGIGV